MPDDLTFQCNLCGALCHSPLAKLTREDPSCSSCGSNVRTRSLLHILSQEMLHCSVPLKDFPVLKSLRGLGISDIPQYSEMLATKFDYRNTFHDRAPRFDLMHPPESELGQYDFVIVSDVLEHVPPPAETGFKNAYALLKPGGVVIMSVPYSIEDAGTIEHFPNVHRSAVVDVGGQAVMLNRTAEGGLEVFENLVFHLGATPSLEMREYSELGLRELLSGAGFDEIRWHGGEYLPYGIVWNEQWSLPLSLRKGRPTYEAGTMSELMAELGAARKSGADLQSDFDSLSQRKWVKLGRTLGAL